MEEELLSEMAALAKNVDLRQMNALQLAYVGDTIHDLYVRTALLDCGMTVGRMHKCAIRLVSAHAQTEMLKKIHSDLTAEEEEIVKRGRNAQAKHAAPKHASVADYSLATGLEALWGYLYITGQYYRITVLMKKAMDNMEELWEKQH